MLYLSNRFLVKVVVLSLVEWFATMLPNKGQNIHPERMDLTRFPKLLEKTGLLKGYSLSPFHFLEASYQIGFPVWSCPYILLHFIAVPCFILKKCCPQPHMHKGITIKLSQETSSSLRQVKMMEKKKEIKYVKMQACHPERWYSILSGKNSG